MSAVGLSETRLLTSPSLDLTSTGVKWKVPHLQGVRIKRWGILLSAAPGDAGVVTLRKTDTAGTATILSTINLLTTHTADDVVYAELTSSSSVGIGTPSALPIVAGDSHLDVNVSNASASVSAEYVVIEYTLEPSEPGGNSSLTVTT